MVISVFTHHNQALSPITQPPFLGNVQYPRGIRFGKNIGCVPRDDGEEDMAGEVVLDEVHDWRSDHSPLSASTWKGKEKGKKTSEYILKIPSTQPPP